MGNKIIFCNCKGEIGKKHNIGAIESFLKDEKIPYYNLVDLCGLAALNNNKLQELFANDKNLIIACHKRAVDKIINHPEDQLSFINHRKDNLDKITQRILEFKKQNSIIGIENTTIESSPDWPSWYPVIDYNRCTNCGQCSDFCLFGVYEKKDNKVQVVNPQKCKNNCPACARICPHTAIIFPKFEEGGAISGSDEINDAIEKSRLKNDLEKIAGGDIYKTLEMRKRKRKSIIKKEVMEKAVAEREAAFQELNKKKI